MGFEIITLIIVLIFIILFSCVMYIYNRQDLWFQMLWLSVGVVTFIFLLVFAYYASNVGMNYPQELDRVYIDNVNPRSNNISMELINQGTTFHVFRFQKLESKEEKLFQKADFCFIYNNTDAANAVQVTNLVTPISDIMYLPNQTNGTRCLDINISYVKHSNYLGLNCLDCSAGNVLYHVTDNTALDMYQTEISKSDPLVYNVVYQKPHIWWLEVRTPPYRSINQLFFIYLWVISIFILLLGLRTIVLGMEKSKEVITDNDRYL